MQVDGRERPGVARASTSTSSGSVRWWNYWTPPTMEAIARDFGDRKPEGDPVIHFYELFLKVYDPHEKVKRSIFYTPRPVVSYIVRSVDELLRSEFGLADGLADTTTWGEIVKRYEGLKIPQGTKPDDAFVQILDPATGTGTFLVEVIDLIHKTMTGKWKAQGHGAKEIDRLWNEYVPCTSSPGSMAMNCLWPLTPSRT